MNEDVETEWAVRVQRPDGAAELVEYSSETLARYHYAVCLKRWPGANAQLLSRTVTRSAWQVGD